MLRASSPSRSFAVLGHSILPPPDKSSSSSNSDEKDCKLAVVLHGMLGNRRNLRSFSLGLARANPGWRFLLLDHLAHGESPSPKSLSPNDANLQNCAQSVLETIEYIQNNDDARVAAGLGMAELPTLSHPSLIIGHSFGGKVALELSRQILDTRNDKQRKRNKKHHGAAALHTWLLDSLVGEVDEPLGDGKKHTPSSQSVTHVLSQLTKVRQPIISKEELVRELVEDLGLDPAIASWMTTNLRHKEGSENNEMEFKFDLPAAAVLLDRYREADYLPYLSALNNQAEEEEGEEEEEEEEAKVFVVRAQRNPVWTEELIGSMRQAGGRILLDFELADAGHWVHMDQPNALASLIQTHSLDVL